MKKELNAVLSKYGLKSERFDINVISINQKGGQTAYSITNNYYRDTNYIEDSINFRFYRANAGGQSYLVLSPQKGSWLNPFVYYDSTKGSPIINAAMLTISPKPDVLSYKGRLYKMFRILIPSARTPGFPISVNLNYKGILVFGDLSDEKKSYIYDTNNVIWFPQGK